MSIQNEKNNDPIASSYSPMLFKKIDEIKSNQTDNSPRDGIYCKGGHDRTSHSRGGGYCKRT